MSLHFATPAAALAAFAGLVPLTVAIMRSRRAARIRRELGLADPAAATRWARPVALAIAFALLGVAAAQPSLVREQKRLVRTDVQMLVVLDTSRSMLASRGPASPPRYRRAASFARVLQASVPELPAGVASLNNRLLPYLFPTSDPDVFDVVVRQAYGIQQPPPADDPDPLATDFGELGAVTTQRFFAPDARRHLLVVLSDAETRAFDARRMLSELRKTGTTPVVVRFWQPGEAIYRAGRLEGSYHSTQADELTRLRAAGWAAYPEDRAAAAVRRIEALAGSGPHAWQGYRRDETSIAAAFVLAALAPILLVLVPAQRFPRLRRRQASPASGPTAAK